MSECRPTGLKKAALLFLLCASLVLVPSPRSRASSAIENATPDPVIEQALEQARQPDQTVARKAFQELRVYPEATQSTIRHFHLEKEATPAARVPWVHNGRRGSSDRLTR